MLVSDIDDLCLLTVDEDTENDGVGIMCLVKKDVIETELRPAERPQLELTIVAQRDIIMLVDHPRPQRLRLVEGPGPDLG